MGQGVVVVGARVQKRTNLLRPILVPVTLYSSLPWALKKTFSGLGLVYTVQAWYTLWQEATKKQCLLIKTTHAVIYIYSLLCVFIPQYSRPSNKLILSRWVKLKWGQRGPVPN